MFARNSSGTQQIADHRPDHAQSAARQTHHLRSVPGSGRVTETPKAASCRIRHHFSGAGAAYSP
jgi:hypothetical protein